MHEMSIAENILDLIRDEMDAYPGAKLVAFDIQVGELSCCQEEALRFCLDAALEQSDWADTEVRITTEPVAARCKACGTAFRPAEHHFQCPNCSGADVEVTGGQEVHLKSLEIDT
jgi:hydrogenase nickel incorporation protein HypA/HybF